MIQQSNQLDKRNFRNKRYEKSTELSKYIWSLQESGIKFTIRWKILSHFKEITKRGYCRFRLTEKLWLLHYFTIYTYSIRNLNSLVNADMGLSYWYRQSNTLSQKINSMINLN